MNFWFHNSWYLYLGQFLNSISDLVLVMSFIIGGLAIILPALSLFTKYPTMINRAMLYNYPCSSQVHSLILITYFTHPLTLE
uniref:NADH dehydrogenase [ubiquinone] 1 alpha subcomplex subunit 3 n=1 Tax=Suricata suricatta TaxID=37032 RepID=A0A673UEH3_SURSU